MKSLLSGIPFLPNLFSVLVTLAICLQSPAKNMAAEDQRQDVPREKSRPNVLFIIVDDLRPQLGCYGEGSILTPNIDQFAAQALLFERAYCQQAVCMASRHSMLSGFRPDERKIWTNRDVRKALSDIDYFPGHFRKHGYHTIGIGKIAHNSWEDPRCWSEKHIVPENIAYEYRTRAGRKIVETMQREAAAAGLPDPFRNVVEKIRRGMPWEIRDVEDNELGDGQIADLALEALDRAGDRPLFLGVGFLRPHLPFVAPRRYWDMYQADELPVADTTSLPDGAPREADNRSRELLTQYRGLPKALPLDPEVAKQLVHGYYASVSYIDAQIGRVLDGLRERGMEGNTIVVITSDHGFQLGDQGMWGKATNFEKSAKVPLLIKAPGMDTAGQRSAALVELVGLYPTLCDLAGLPKPDHLQGSSFAGVLADPDLEIREVATSQYQRGGAMGHSIRTRDFRYTEWRKLDGGDLINAALYDLRDSAVETSNVVDRKEFAGLVTELASILKKERDERVFE